MAEKASEKVVAEIDKTRIKIIYSTQYIKAQSWLTDKLKKQIQHSRETCEYVRSANLKLQSEIVEAERIINSMRPAQETINMANVELKKELLLTKDKRTDLIKKIETSEKKYDAMWLESKNRFETIPHVQKLINANEKLDNTKTDIFKLNELSLKLVEEIDSKTKKCADINKKRAIELAVFFVRDIPKYHKIIDEKTKAIADLSDKIREFETKVTCNSVTEVQANCKTAADSEWPMFKTNDIMIMPTLELPGSDFDSLSMQLDQVNIEKTNTDNLNNETKEPLPKTRFEINMFQSTNKDDLISSYFPKLMNHEENATENYSKRKLINLLQDVKINKDEAMKMFSKVNRNSLEPVEVIGAKKMKTEMIQKSARSSLDSKSKEPIQSEEIEEIDLTSKSENILNPPSPFLDVTTITITTEVSFFENEAQTLKKEVTDLAADGLPSNVSDNLEEVEDEEELPNSVKEVLQPQALSQQKDVASATKRVSFNLSSNLKSNEAVDLIEENATCEINVTAASDDDYANIKDMVMKKHNLNISPQFVYAKNTNLQKNTENSIVTSKFFQQTDNGNTDVAETETVNNILPDEKPLGTATSEEDQPEGCEPEIKNIEFDGGNDDAVTSPNMAKPMDEPQSIKPVKGFIFNHGGHGIPDSMDLSFNTTGYEDGDNDFPHCLDSSVLLSPKANLPSPSGSNTEVSQDGPNFLTGLRKAGLSFFGMVPTSESKPDSNAAQNTGTNSGFSFNFGGEKKARGGLFSMFQ